MAKRSNHPKTTTPPKGRPTPKRDVRPQRRNRAIYGWIAVALLVGVLVGVAIYFGSDQEIQPLPGVGPAFVGAHADIGTDGHTDLVVAA